MAWWALVPVVSMITGPVALYVLSRRKRRTDEAEERYEELAHRYDELLEKSTPADPPHGTGTGSQRPESS
ncbi:hypothetical protein [Streptomyces sp. NPDC005573]|uniref:hypothetical protein n=1 Tax=unclassified Streptomyces TaxID=2593676 RepID=UPI0033A216A6